MRQNTTQFMDELLKDNTTSKPAGEDLGEKIASIIDQKMKEAMSKYTEALSQVNPPESNDNDIERKELIEDENTESKGESDNGEDE